MTGNCIISSFSCFCIFKCLLRATEKVLYCIMRMDYTRLPALVLLVMIAFEATGKRNGPKRVGDKFATNNGASGDINIELV